MRCSFLCLAIVACALLLSPFAIQAQDNLSTTCLEWNSFLQPMFNIEENANYNSNAKSLTSTMYDIGGNPVDSTTLSIASGGQTDLIVSGMSGFAPNSYGLVCSPSSSSTLNSRMMFYKLDPSGTSYQFAFAAENNARSGEQYVFFNTYQPSLAPQDSQNFVANWVQISNPVENSPAEALTGKLYFYSMEGRQIDVQEVTVPAGGRTDVSAHRLGASKVGICQWVPDDPAAIFQVRNVRYLYDNNGAVDSFESAFQLPGVIGRSDSLVVPVDTTNASAILEVGNSSGMRQTSISIQLYNASGQLVAGFNNTLAPRASQHFILDSYLTSQRGIAVITGDSIFAVGMEYLRRSDGGIYSLYGIPAAPQGGSVVRGSYNQYLNQESELWLVNRGTADSATFSLVRSDGNVRANNVSVGLPQNGLEVVQVSAYEQPENYGVATVTGENKLAWLLRRRGTDYVIPLQLSDGSSTLGESSDLSASASTSRSTLVSGACSNDTEPPHVSIRWSNNGITISGTVTISIAATDNAGISSIDFKVDGTTVTTLTSKPYKYLWNTNTVSNGPHYAEAVAHDCSGHTDTYRVDFSVNNADTTPPTVSLGLAKSGSVTSPFDVTVSANDNSGAISKIELYKDGGTTPYGTLTGVSSGVFSVTATAGTHTLYAKAYDAAGLSTTSSTISVTVTSSGDTTPPTVSITSPTSGSTVSGSVPITASASDAGGINYVRFDIDGVMFASDNTAPYNATWISTGGTHTLTAVAFDNAGNTTTSASITLIVGSRDGGGQPYKTVRSFAYFGADWKVPATYDAQVSFMANTLNIIGGIKTDVNTTDLKAKNPNVTVIQYQNALGVRDPDVWNNFWQPAVNNGLLWKNAAGSNVTFNGFTAVNIHDISKQDIWVNNLLGNFDSGTWSGYAAINDGLFLDNAAGIKLSFLSSTPVVSTNGPMTDAKFVADLDTVLRRVTQKYKSKYPSKKIYYNGYAGWGTGAQTGVPSLNGTNAPDGIIVEGFTGAGDGSSNYIHGRDRLRTHFKDMATVASYNKEAIIMDYVSPLTAQQRVYALANYLLVANTKTTYGPMLGSSVVGPYDAADVPEYFVDLGSPGATPNYDASDLLVRTYSKGIVITNISDTQTLSYTPSCTNCYQKLYGLVGGGAFNTSRTNAGLQDWRNVDDATHPATTISVPPGTAVILRPK